MVRPSIVMPWQGPELKARDITPGDGPGLAKARAKQRQFIQAIAWNFTTDCAQVQLAYRACSFEVHVSAQGPTAGHFGSLVR